MSESRHIFTIFALAPRDVAVRAGLKSVVPSCSGTGSTSRSGTAAAPSLSAMNAGARNGCVKNKYVS